MPIYRGTQRRTLAFPLGGIGTGCVSLGGNGSLVDWEIFHRPNKGCLLPNTFFSLWTRTADGKIDARVLQSLPDMPLIGNMIGHNFTGFGFGVERETGMGLRHLRSNAFRGEYPFAWIDYDDPRLPVEISLMAYNPFIPLNVDDSGLPVAIFEFTVTNSSEEPVEVSLAANLFNAVGYRGFGAFTYIEHGEYKGTGDQNVNRFVRQGDLSAILMSSETYAPDEPFGGTMALSTTWPDITYQTAWLRGAWFDTLQIFWDEFSSTGRLTDRTYTEPSPKNSSDTGSLALHVWLQAGQTVRLPVYMTWHFPNFIKYWDTSYAPAINPHIWTVPYARRFADALAVAEYAAAEEPRLREETELFHQTLYGSTLPESVLDAVTSQISTLKTNTVTLLADGSFYGWEGQHSTAGSCEGSCEHVWNYAITHAYLFPELERSMRHNDYVYSQFEDGRMAFRLSLPLGSRQFNFHPAADGQMGGIMQTYRDWKLSGDTEWLRNLWPYVRKSLEYAWKFWDYNQDGVMEGLQHNTYDIEFYGPNTMMQSWYLGALRCGAEMAEAVSDHEAALTYRKLADAGQHWTDEQLFNGEYYEQQIDLEAIHHSPMSTDISLGGQREGNPKYQYGSGCLSDQLVGAWLARVCGLGPLFDADHTRTTLDSIYRYNFKPSLEDHDNAQRIYALGDEAGLVLCTWPRGSRPDLPFVYSDEVWTGIEYQVAAHLIYEGLADEALPIVDGVRARYTGERRNPWNELECGSHYVRALSSWSLLLAYSGFECDMTVGHIGFNPVIHRDSFRCFWSTGTGWGEYEQTDDEAILRVLYGHLPLQSWRIGSAAITASLNDSRLAADIESKDDGARIRFTAPLDLQPGDVLTAAI